MLTDIQTTALRTWCLNDPTAAAFFQAQNPQGLLAYLNGASGTNVWRSDTPVEAIINAISWTAFTPADAPDGTALFSNRTYVINIKQMNLQLMLQGRTTLDCTRPNIRGGLRDSVIAVPAGVGGASVTAGGAGGATVLAACLRSGTRAEIALAAGTQASDTTGSVSARVPTFTGALEDGDVNRLVFKDDGSVWTL